MNASATSTRPRVSRVVRSLDAAGFPVADDGTHPMIG